MRYVIDTNILVYAVGSSFAEHSIAKRFLDDLLKRGVGISLTWNIVYEFLRVSTHPKVFSQPLSSTQASAVIETLFSNENVSVLEHGRRHLGQLSGIVEKLHRPAGNIFHDIHTATIMKESGLSEIVTADKDFLQFDFLKVVNPFIG